MSEEADAQLAAVVEKARGEATIAALRAEGTYDPERRVREHDDGTIAIPVTAPPETSVLDVVEQRDPEARTRDLDDLLAERGWSAAEIDAAPASWAVVGSVVLVDVPADCPDERDVGEALLDLHREADTVLAREGIDGPTREPTRRVIAGLGDTETVHVEHGVRYALDLAEVMFSPGNKAERARIGALVAASADDDSTSGGESANGATDASGDDRPAITVDPDDVPGHVPDLDPTADDAATGDDEGDDTAADGERAAAPREHVFDMFAGAGYFTLPAALAGAQVTAAEVDPDTFRYLIENARLNDVGDRVSPYLADCREVAAFVDADRVVMGHYDAAEYLDAAFEAVCDGGERERSERDPRRTESGGGVLHYHAVVHESDLPDRPTEHLADAAERAGRTVDVVDVRRVKSYGEGVWHVVADARVGPGV